MIYTTSRGFTLIELLVVISIIGALASMVISSLTEARTSAMYTVAKVELKLIEDALLIASDPSELMQITGSGCSMCSCRDMSGGGLDLRSVTDSDVCFTRWRTSIQNIAHASALLDNTNALLRDPWGSPYLLDENELEYASPRECRRDSLRSAGPDGIKDGRSVLRNPDGTPQRHPDGSFVLSDLYGSGDDYIIILPYRTPTCRP